MSSYLLFCSSSFPVGLLLTLHSTFVWCAQKQSSLCSCETNTVSHSKLRVEGKILLPDICQWMEVYKSHIFRGYHMTAALSPNRKTAPERYTSSYLTVRNYLHQWLRFAEIFGGKKTFKFTEWSFFLSMPCSQQEHKFPSPRSVILWFRWLQRGKNDCTFFTEALTAWEIRLHTSLSEGSDKFRERARGLKLAQGKSWIEQSECELKETLRYENCYECILKVFLKTPKSYFLIFNELLFHKASLAIMLLYLKQALQVHFLY